MPTTDPKPAAKRRSSTAKDGPSRHRLIATRVAVRDLLAAANVPVQRLTIALDGVLTARVALPGVEETDALLALHVPGYKAKGKPVVLPEGAGVLVRFTVKLPAQAPAPASEAG